METDLEGAVAVHSGLLADLLGVQDCSEGGAEGGDGEADHLVQAAVHRSENTFYHDSNNFDIILYLSFKILITLYRRFCKSSKY